MADKRVYTGFDQYGGSWQPKPDAAGRMRQQLADKPVATYALLATVGVFYLAEMLVSGSRPELFGRIFTIAPDWPSRPWSLVTSTLSHGSPMHLLFNGFMLYFFGSAIERILGRGKYLALFFISGALSGIIQVAITGGAALGASGALMAFLGVALIIMPKVKVMIFPLPVEIPLWVVGIGYVALDLLGVFGASPFGGNIGHFAHLAGLAIGLLVGQKTKQDLESKGLKLRFA
ncbi:MAG: rhomboid family intramembrane serine protease [Thermoplasmatota archaeon]